LAGINSELGQLIEDTAKSNASLIHNYLAKLKLETLSFHDLEWRLDVKLATRSLRRIVEPEIVLKFDFIQENDNNIESENKNIQTRILQTDVVNLNHLTNSLEDALNEIKSNYCRRVFRNAV
jgi:hypothetical protein